MMRMMASLIVVSYDQKSDMWSIGCALYELMTSSRAFEATVSEHGHGINLGC